MSFTPKVVSTFAASRRRSLLAGARDEAARLLADTEQTLEERGDRMSDEGRAWFERTVKGLRGLIEKLGGLQ